MPENTEILQAQAGRFDGEISSVGFHEGDSVNVLLGKLSLDLSEGDEINDEAGNSVSGSDIAEAGKTYYIVSNYKNGCS